MLAFCVISYMLLAFTRPISCQGSFTLWDNRKCYPKVQSLQFSETLFKKGYKQWRANKLSPRKVAERVAVASSGNTHSCGKRSNKFEAIVGGQEAGEYAWPWQAIIWAAGGLTCGGTLIDEYWILTAAQCLTNDKDEYDFFGTASLGRIPRDGQADDFDYYMWYDKQYIHERYRAPPTLTPNGMAQKQNDIALIHLKIRTWHNERIQPACLPHPRINLRYRLLDCYMTGFGHEKRPGHPEMYVLKQVQVQIISRKACMRWWRGYLRAEHICVVPTSGKGPSLCLGDGGGPLICRNSKDSDVWWVAGIASFTFADCDARFMPNVFTSVPGYLTWIRNITKLP